MSCNTVQPSNKILEYLGRYGPATAENISRDVYDGEIGASTVAISLRFLAREGKIENALQLGPPAYRLKRPC